MADNGTDVANVTGVANAVNNAAASSTDAAAKFQAALSALPDAAPDYFGWPFAADFVIIVSAVAMSAAMIIGLVLVFDRLKSLKRGFGPLTFRLTAALIFIPALFFLTLAQKLDQSALTALWGAVAGYLLADKAKKEDEGPPKTEPVAPPTDQGDGGGSGPADGDGGGNDGGDGGGASPLEGLTKAQMMPVTQVYDSGKND